MEDFKAIPVPSNSSAPIPGKSVKGFVPTAAGTWTFTLIRDGVTTVFPDITVVAGNVGLFHGFPAFAGTSARSSVTTSGGGAGILFVT